MRDAVVIGPFPPPRHGLAVATASAAEGLRLCGWDTTILDTSPGRMLRDVVYYWRRVTRMANRLVLAVRLRRQDPELVYSGVSGGRGLLFDALLVRIVSGKKHPRVLFHHHSFQYINRSTVWMRFLVRIQPAGSTHLVLCDRMREEFVRIYGVPADRVLVVGNLALRSVAGEDISESNPAESSTGSLNVGFLGTLSAEKGLGLFFEVADRVSRHDSNLEVHFSCAGPVGDEYAQRVVPSTSVVEYVGVLSGDEVAEFLRGLDLVLFPSMYVNEAQPNVIIESLGAGVPILCTPRGCTRDLLSPYLEDMIVEEDQFVDAAISLIVSMSDHQPDESELRRRTRLQFDEINERARREAKLLKELFS